MSKLNYNIFLDLLEKHGLLTGAWCGLIFDELPGPTQKEIEICVAKLRVEFAYEGDA